MPVCDPPFGNDTHLPHSGRIHSCPNTLELTTIAAKTIEPRIHVLLFGVIRYPGHNMVGSAASTKSSDPTVLAAAKNVWLPSIREARLNVLCKTRRCS